MPRHERLVAAPDIHRFACTRCGACCNRAPEVALSEAAALADHFVFRLMVSLYWLPDRPVPGQNADGGFYERKRLLADFAARASPTKAFRDGKRVPYTKYLVFSALAADTRAGHCVALMDGGCAIYPQRPLACRTVPLHYSRGDHSAASDLAAFVASPGYRCDTSDTAPVLIDNGRIVDEPVATARHQARQVALNDRRWSTAIARQVGNPAAADLALPTIAELQASAGAGAMTTTMAPAWRVAVDIGLMTPGDYQALLARQLALLGREIATADCPPTTRETLLAMHTEYQRLRENR